MGYLHETIPVIAPIFAFLWAALFLRTWLQERARRSKEAREAERERLLSTPGEPLFCVACQKSLGGPLPEDGCPHCHCTAFVVPDRLRERASKTRLNVFRSRLNRAQ